jgi:hypothetical protein
METNLIVRFGRDAVGFIIYENQTPGAARGTVALEEYNATILL